MKLAYTLVGLTLIGLILGAYYFSSRSLTSPSTTTTMLTLTSTAFRNGESIPSKYTCDASNISPDLSISGVPDGTKMLVLIMDDPDVPKALKPDGVFDHWVLYSIPPETTHIPEGEMRGNPGLNGRAQDAYTGPCPPPQYEPSTHRYFFKLYAVDTILNFIKIPTKSDVLSAIQGHIIEQTELMGTYKRVAQ